MKINRLRIKSRISVLLSAAAFVTACQVDEPLELTDRFFPPDLVEVEEPEVTTFVFSSEGEDQETKTEHSGSTIIWSAGDMIRMGFTVNNVWQGDNGNAASYSSAMIYASTALAEGGPTANFSVPTTFTGNTQGTYKFYTLYPSSACGTGFESEGVVKATIPTEQTPAAASFDPKSDLLAGTSVRTYSSKPTEAIPLMWTRLVAHGEITLRNIKDLGSDETVESVTLTAQSGASLTGSYLLDLTTPAIGNGVEPSNSVTVKGDNLSFDGSNLTFWIGILPVTMTSLEVELKTDKATYTRSIPSCNLQFAGNTHNRLGINMASATRTGNVQYYERVSSSQTDWSGQYVLGYDDGTIQKMLTGISTTSTKYGIATDVTITDDKIAYETGHPYEITIAKSGSYYTMSFGGKYLSWNSGNSLILANSPTDNLDGWKWTISYSNGTLTISNANTSQRLLQYNTDSPRFACYTSAQQAPSLYKLTGSSGGDTPPDPQPEATATVTTAPASGIGPAGATLNGSYSGATGRVYETGFYWGTSISNLDQTVTTDGSNASSGSFSCTLTSLQASTTYYFKAYVLEYNASTGQYEERVASEVKSFVTSASGGTAPASFKSLELPALTGSEDYYGRFYGSGGNTEENRNYSYNYSYTWYASLWVAWPLTSSHTSGNESSSWKYNPNIAQNKQVNIVSNSYGTMYGNDAYSRGHQCPNADRKSDDAMNQHTYYSTNQTPQRQNKFNGSIWGSLETATRNLLSSADTVYVVTGPAYRKVGGNESITYLTGVSGKNANPSRLPVPNYYWKALLKVKWSGNGTSKTVSSASAIGFWFVHQDYANNTPFANYAVSVNQIETWTGFDLFANLPDGIEATAEANTNWTTFQNF